MGNFFTALFGGKSEKPEANSEKNNKKNFEIFKYDGLRAQRMGRPDYAVKCFTEALAIEEDFETLGYLSQLYIELGELTEAHNRLNRMVELEPELPSTYLAIAKICFLQGEYKAMEEAAQQAVAREAENPVAHYLLGKAVHKLSDPLMSVAHLTRAIALQEKYIDARLLRADVLLRMGQATEARQDTDFILQQDPDEEAALLLQGEINQAEGDPQSAEADFRRVAEINPFNEQAYLYLGELYLTQQRPEEAIALFDEAIELNPNFEAAYRERGRAKQQIGDQAGSVEDLKKSLELNPEEGARLNGAFTNLAGNSGDILGL